MAQSHSVFLSVPHENIDHLRYLDIGEGLLEIQPQSDPKDDNDIGCIPSLQMPITLKDDNIPAQRAYLSVPKPLFNEVKVYIQIKHWKPLIAPSFLGKLKLDMTGRCSENKTNILKWVSSRVSICAK